MKLKFSQSRVIAEAFKLMKPVRGIETDIRVCGHEEMCTFKLMKPVRGIETRQRLEIRENRTAFQINETRSRD